MRRHASSILRIVTLIVALARVGHAQEMRGTVRDSASGQPIAGAVLMLLDASGAPLGRNITDQRGQYRIALSGGMARVRIVRIGFRPRDVRIPEPVGGIARLDISMVTIPTLLEPVRVSDDSRCSRRADRAAALGLWEQARAGLLATVVARDLAPASVVRLTFERSMDAAGDKIVSQRVALDTASRQAKPFVAAHTAADFARRGFAENLAGEWWFYAPDADVLLDEAFARNYCFHLMDRDRSRPGQIGLGFLPASRPRDRIDVDGALWIDTLTRALSDIDFRYIGLDRDIDRYRPGGRVAFRAMTNGLVMIDRWSLRLVGTRVDTIGRTRNGPLLRTRFDVYETGGEVARAWWPDGTLWKASLGELRLHATTHAHTPAAGALLQLNGTTYKATVDATGDLVIPDLLPGPYSVVIDEPTMATIRLTLKTGLEFTAARDSVSQFALELPTVRDFLVSECRAQRLPTNGPAMILARVMTPDSVPVGQVDWLIRRLGAQSRMDKESPILDAELLSRGGLTAAHGLITFCGKKDSATPIGSSAEIRVSEEKVDPIMIEVALKDTVTVVPIIWPHPVRRPRN